MSRRGRDGPACPPAFGVVNQIRADTQVCPYNRINSPANCKAREYRYWGTCIFPAPFPGMDDLADSRPARSVTELYGWNRLYPG
jgi:hypothetical protein